MQTIFPNHIFDDGYPSHVARVEKILSGAAPEVVNHHFTIYPLTGHAIKITTCQKPTQKYIQELRRHISEVTK